MNTFKKSHALFLLGLGLFTTQVAHAQLGINTNNTAPTSTLQVVGSSAATAVEVSASQTLGDQTFVRSTQAANTAVTLTLPALTTTNSRYYTVFSSLNTGATTVLKGSGSENIFTGTGNANTFTLTAGQSATFVNVNGLYWQVVALSSNSSAGLTNQITGAENGLSVGQITAGKVGLGGSLGMNTTVNQGTNYLQFASTTGTLYVDANDNSNVAVQFRNSSSGASTGRSLMLNSGGSGHALYLGQEDGSSTMGTGPKSYLDNRSGGRLAFGTSGTEQMTLATNGNVGIGTTTPNAPLQLSNGTANRKVVLYDNSNNDYQFYGFGLQSHQLRYQTDGTGSDHVFLAAASSTASNELMRIQGTGNVGIGTSAPSEELHIFNATTTKANMLLEGTGGGGSSLGYKIRSYNSMAAGTAVVYGATDDGNSSERASIFVPNAANNGITEAVSVLKSTGNVGIGTTAPSSLLQVNGVITATKIQGPSDMRFKKNITRIPNALTKVLALNGYTYDWKDAAEFPGQSLGKGHDMGVIAQEVEKQFPEAVSTNAQGYKAVSYTELVPALIEAMKAQQAEIEELKAEVKALKK